MNPRPHRTVTERCKVWGMAKIPVMVRLEPAEADALKTAADRQTRSMSQLARVFVVDGLTRIHDTSASLVRMAAPDPLPRQTTIDGEGPA